MSESETIEDGVEGPDVHGAGRAPVGWTGRVHLGGLGGRSRQIGSGGGTFEGYDGEYCGDRVECSAFPGDAELEAREGCGLSEEGPTRGAFRTRPQAAVGERGTMEVGRSGITHGALKLRTCSRMRPLFTTRRRGEQCEPNRFTVTWPLRCSWDYEQRALDIGLFISGHGRHGGRTPRRLRLRRMERGQHGEAAIQGSTGRNVLPPLLDDRPDSRTIGQAEVATVGDRVTP